MIISELDLSRIEEIVVQCGTRREAVIPILQAIQHHYHYLPRTALKRVCELTDITPADITGVSTFYTHFRHQPVGRHMIHVCQGTACHVKGAELVRDAVALHLGLEPGHDTDARGEFTVQPVACLGCCTLAPVMQIDDATYGRMTPRSVPRVVTEALRADKHPRPIPHPSANSRAESLGEIRIGLGSCCQAQGSGRVHDEILAVLHESGAAATVKRVGCIGMCHQTPLMQLVTPSGDSQFFSHVQPKDVRNIVLRHFRPRGIVRQLGYRLSRWLDAFHSNEEEDPVVAHALDVREQAVCAFLGPQKHIATEFCGDLDPLDLDEYLRHDGFVALRRCLNEYDPAKIVEEVRRSGLRGRGGGGFPTHIKWRKAREAPGDTKYVICNGDEGDPGAFMDRMLLESFPYRVIEGMTIAARAIGAREAIFYIRAEYPLAVKRIREAIQRCEKHGLIGDGVLGSDLHVKFGVMEGAGAFICGEETALINSMEGHRGTPTLRPPYPVECGLWERPTLINNVETLACLPWIFRHGGNEFAKLGTGSSKGTKVFALAGKVLRGGLIEVSSPCGRLWRTSAAACCRDASSRPCRWAVRPEAVSPPRWPTRRSTTRRWSRWAPSWGAADWSCSTTPIAWSTSPATSCASRRTSRVANARSAASAPSGCWRSWIAFAPATAGRET
jgi:NADH-quinone oxidoreductase subunit F